ncbi:MAG TPA: EamA family transporter [Methylomirabilota bacterium]|nr:EamA family transporter [Methylomirabilota bacterium]
MRSFHPVLSAVVPYTTRAMLLGLALIALAAVSWGTTGATMTLLSREVAVSPLLVGWARLAIAAPCLLAGAALREMLAPAGADRELGRLLTPAVWRERTLGPLLVTGLAMAGYQACYFTAVTLTGVAAAALLAICSAPILIAVLAATFLGERLTRAVLVCLVMAVSGTALLVMGPRGPGAIAGHFGVGALLALGAGLCYAVYAVTAKGLVSRLQPLTIAAATFTLGAVFLAPVLASAGRADLLQRAALPPLLYLGIGPTAVAYALFCAGLRRVPATAAGIITLLEPLTATTLGVLVFGESLGVPGAVGAGLMVAALVLLTAARPGPRARDPVGRAD